MEASQIGCKPADERQKASVLYISYDGMLEPLGESQVVAYVERLARYRPIHLLSFEKPEDRSEPGRFREMKARLERAGVAWTPLVYHRSPSVPATAYDIAIGTATARRVALREGVGIIHARSYVAALMALAVKRLTGARLLFDMRGFWVDERVDGGLWPREGTLYRAGKRIERHLLCGADHIVTLTEASSREIQKFSFLQNRTPPVTVIPTCANLDLFSPRQADRAGFTLGYVGSVGTWNLLDETLTFFKVLLRKRPDARLLIVNRGQHQTIWRTIREQGIEEARVEVLAVDHIEVPQQIARMHAGAAINKPCYARVASAPTKIGEYLGCGIPCLGNAGIGDVEHTLEENRVGVVLRNLSPAEMEKAADRLLALAAEPGTRQRCVETASRVFAIGNGVEAYRRIYDCLGEAAAARNTFDG